MGISQLKRYCFEAYQQEQMPSNIQTISEDYQFFQEEKWYTFQNPILFDTNKFIFLYLDYQAVQSKLVKRWDNTLDIKNIDSGESTTEEECMSTRWKYAIKRGVPIRYYRIIISAIFNITFSSSSANSFERNRAEIRLNEALTFFGHEGSSLYEVVIAPFLNEKGYEVLNELLRLLKKKKGENFYNKYICHLTALFLIFFNERQTYELLSHMIEMSSNMSKARWQSLRWHFVFREEQMKYLASSFFSIIHTNSPTVTLLIKKMQANRVDQYQLFNIVVQNFFYGYLPFSFILKIFIIFLNQGVMIFLRVFYAILHEAYRELSDVTSLNKASLVIKKKCLCLKTHQLQKMLKYSFNLRFKTAQNPRLVEERLKIVQSDRKFHYLPFIEGTSNILSFQDLQVIWSFLPFELKICDLRLTYPPMQSQLENLSLPSLLKSIKGAKYNLIVIETIDSGARNIFGAFILGGLQEGQTSQWYGNKQNFVFTLHPLPKAYRSSLQNSHYLLSGENSLKIGSGPMGNGLFLSKQLMTAESYHSTTFRNRPLNGGTEGQFQINWIEAFTLF